MKFQDKEFIEFFEECQTFQEEVVNVQDPDFLELVNHTVASAAGAKLYLAPETFLALRRWSSAGNVSTSTTSTRRTYPYNSYKKAKTYSRRAQSYNHSNTDKGNKVTKDEEMTKVKETITLGPEQTALDASGDYLTGGPYKDSKQRIDPENCCQCWNWNETCKYLDEQERCRKLHICMHPDCRTLYHHGHRLKDHNNRSR